MAESAETGAAEAPEDVRGNLIEAAVGHVVFDGWSATTLEQAARDEGVEMWLAREAFPRGGVDLAFGFHCRRDDDLARFLATADMGAMRFRDRVAFAVMKRLELVAGERDAVRRGAALFALPHHSADGARAVWHTADTIWTALGDTSTDYNWYTKRATLSGVYSAAALYWLGDETEDFSATREFVDRRIDNVMQFERFKSKLRESPLAGAFRRGPGRLLDRVRAPADTPRPDLPGFIRNRD